MNISEVLNNINEKVLLDKLQLKREIIEINLPKKQI